MKTDKYTFNRGYVFALQSPKTIAKLVVPTFKWYETLWCDLKEIFSIFMLGVSIAMILHADKISNLIWGYFNA